MPSHDGVAQSFVEPFQPLPAAHSQLQLFEPEPLRQLMQAAHEHESGPVALMLGVDHHAQDGAPVPGEGAATVHEQPHPDRPLPITKDAERVLAGGDPGQGGVQRRGDRRHRRGSLEADAAASVGHGNPGGQEVRPQPCVERVGRAAARRRIRDTAISPIANVLQ